MHSSDGDNDPDTNGESRRPTAVDESKSVDNEKHFTDEMSESGNATNTIVVGSRDGRSPNQQSPTSSRDGAIKPPASSELLLLEKDEDVYFQEKNENNVLDCDLTKIKYTSREQLHKITANDSTVEVIGYIDTIEPSRLVGAKNGRRVKFYLNNGSGDRIQVVAWRCEVDRCEAILKPNLILHIDGAYAKPCSIGNFNKGTINIELVIQSATKLNIFGRHSIPKHASVTAPELVLLKNIGGATNKCIKVQGFVKTNFGIIRKQSTSAGNDFGCGSITDGTFKIEVHIPKMENTPHHLVKGDHVEVEGELQMNENPIYIRCISINDIKKIDNEKMPLKQLLQGYNIIPTEKKNKNYEPPQKKIRRS